jgi:endonuclease-3
MSKQVGSDRARVKEIIKLLKQEYPEAKIALEYSNPLELLVAVILSAQCTDKRVNEVTKTLFKKYKEPADYANVPLEELEQDIKPTGFYRNKAKNIQAAANMILEKFEGEIPPKMEDILKLPGVARKTANIVLGNAYGIVEGIAVDTHVKRLSQRLGLTKEKNADKIEEELMQVVPREDWFKFTYLLIDHGRAICQAKKPLCAKCILNQLCPSAFTFD